MQGLEASEPVDRLDRPDQAGRLWTCKSFWFAICTSSYLSIDKCEIKRFLEIFIDQKYISWDHLKLQY